MHFSSFLQGKANPQVMAIEPADMGKEGGGQRTKWRGRKKRFSILAWPDSRFTREEVKLQLSCWRETQSFINPGKPPGKEEKKAFLKTRVKGRFFPPHERASASRPSQRYFTVQLHPDLLPAPAEAEATIIFHIFSPMSQSSGSVNSTTKAYEFIHLQYLLLPKGLIETATVQGGWAPRKQLQLVLPALPQVWASVSLKFWLTFLLLASM